MSDSRYPRSSDETPLVSINILQTDINDIRKIYYFQVTLITKIQLVFCSSFLR